MAGEDERVIEGLTVRAYAGVYAAVAEGFPLEIVLEHAGIPADAWAAIDAAWAEGLAQDVDDGGELAPAFDAALAEVQALYRRPIPPLDDDLDAWLRFSRAWSTAPDPAAFLRQRGLEPNDMIRLLRHSAPRIAADEKSVRQAVAILAREDVAPPAVAKPAPVELRALARRATGTRRLPGPLAKPDGTPSLFAALPRSEEAPAVPLRVAALALDTSDLGTTAVGTPALEVTDDMAPLGDTTLAGAEVSPFDSVRLPADFELPPPASVAPMSLSQELSLAQYASYRAELEAFPEHEPAIYVKYGLVEEKRRQRIDQGWMKRLQEETETYAEWRQLYRHFTEHWAAQKR